MPHPPAWATPTDHAELADVMFDAVRNGPSLYTDAQRKSLAAKPLSVVLPRTRSGAQAAQTQSYNSGPLAGPFLLALLPPQREMRVRSGPYGLWSSA
jgi:hypothetical protein